MLLDLQTVPLIQPPLQAVPLLRAELYQADVEVLQVLQILQELLQELHVVLQEDALLHGLLAAAVPPGYAPPGGGVRQVPGRPHGGARQGRGHQLELRGDTGHWTGLSIKWERQHQSMSLK